ncbi:MAG: terminase large subunit [Candidatus Bathyarchaeia archaeon]
MLDNLIKETAFNKRVLELIDPVAWLKVNTGFNPWPHEMELLRDNHIRVRVVRKSRQIGITTTIAHEAVWKAFTSKRVILIVSPSQRQSWIVMSKIQAIVNSNPRLAARVSVKNKNQMQLKSGSVIAATPNNPDRIRGYTANDIYLDEAAHFLNDEPVMRAIKPMLITTQGTFTIVSTPYGKRGLFWDQYRIATDEQATRNDVKAYDLYPSTISPLITKERMERERLNLTELEFRQEYLGEFIEQVDTYLPLDLITSCVDSTLVLQEVGEPGKEYVIGIDFAKQRDETVVILAELEKDGCLVVRQISAWSGMDYREQVGRIGQLAETFKIISGAADQTGVGEAVMEDLKRIIPQVEGIVFTAASKMDLVSGLRSFLEHQRLTLPNDKRLIMQLNGLRYQVSKIGNLLFESPEKDRIHDDYLWSLTLACHAAKLAQQVDRSKPIVRSKR